MSSLIDRIEIQETEETAETGWRGTLRESLRGGTTSLTDGPEGRAIVIIAVTKVL